MRYPVSILVLILLFGFTDATVGAQNVTQWFPGMLTVPQVVPALPDNFIVVSADPTTKESGRFDMANGVIWAPEKTARQFEFAAERNMRKATEPLFFIRLSTNVGQLPGTSSFSHEKELEKTLSLGLHSIRHKKIHWGEYPVLTATGIRPDGSKAYMAWIGLNTTSGWTLFVDYRVPLGENHPTKNEESIWETFLNETRSRAIEPR